MLFANPLGWYAFLAVIPLIILYLRRPMAVQKMVPSLMFFIKQQRTRQRYHFLQQFLRDILFLLQLAAICALAFALTVPYLQIPTRTTKGNTVMVLDVSASMQTRQETTRFEEGVEKARQYLGGKNSIILASHTPLVVLENGGKGAANDVLDRAEPRDTVSNLGDAMLQARNMLGKSGGRVVVVSDFSFTEGTDPLVARKTLSAAGVEVVFISPAKKARNIGIISLDISKTDSTATVKNFNGKEEQVTVNIISNDKTVKSESKTIQPNSVELFNFNTFEGTSEIALIAENDDLDVDNHAFISNPVKNIKVLLITKGDTSIKAALSASPYIKVEEADFPTIPSMAGFDIIVVHNASFDKDYPTFYRELETNLKKGKAVVITAASKTGNFGEVMPVTLKEMVENSTDLLVTATPFTKHMVKERISTQKYYTGEVKKDSQLIVESYDEQPVVAIRKYGEGTMVYYGIYDELSNFRNSISYPIFWNELAGFLVNAQNIADFNERTTAVIVKEGTPQFLDKVGVYEINNRRIAANLIEERESNINYLSERVSEQALTSVEASKEKQDKSLEPTVVAAALLIILIELVYVKMRGDL